VRAIDCDYYTTAITYTQVTILDTFAQGAPEKGYGPFLDEPSDKQGPYPFSAHGEVHVVSRVVGFKKIKFYTNENVGSGELDLPEQQMHTTSYCLTVPETVMGLLPYAADDRRDGVAGLAFAMKQVAQLLLMCDRQDLGLSIGAGDEGAVTDAAHVPDDLDEPRIFLYDSYPGGIGFSEPLFGMHDALLAETRRLIAGCPCDHGCPTCVGPAGESGARAKAVSLAILNGLLDGVPA
jgi:DEAD/DEAH box helicase domain-containing protein